MKRSRHDWDNHLAEYITEEVRDRAEKLVRGIADQDKPKKRPVREASSGCLTMLMLLIVAAIVCAHSAERKLT